MLYRRYFQELDAIFVIPELLCMVHGVGATSNKKGVSQ